MIDRQTTALIRPALESLARQLVRRRIGADALTFAGLAVGWAAAGSVATLGEDWSSDLSEPALIAHVRGRVDHYLSAAIVEQVLGEIDDLAQSLLKTDDQGAVTIGPHRP